MGPQNKVIMDVSFPDTGLAREFAAYCLDNFNINPAVYRTKVFLVLQTFDERRLALKFIKKLGGRLLVSQ